MVTVYAIRPHHAGFGVYERAVEGQTYGDLVTLEDYISYVQQENSSVELLGDGDEDYEEVKDADGKTAGQAGGKVIGWKCRRGDVVLELVYVD